MPRERVIEQQHQRREARERTVEIPQDVERLKQVTSHVHNDIEARFGEVFLVAEQTDAPTQEQHSRTYEEAIIVTQQFQELFFENDDAALATEALRLAGLSDEEFATPLNIDRARRLLQNTAALATRFARMIDSLALLYPGVEHEHVARNMLTRNIEQTHKHEYTLFGTMRLLAARLEQAAKESAFTQAWHFEEQPQLPVQIHVDDPMDASNKRAMNHWLPSTAIEARQGRDSSIVEQSRRTSQALAYDLHALAEHNEENPELHAAYEIIARWVEERLAFYDEEYIERLQQVDFFRESYTELHDIMQAFEVLKMHDRHTQRLFMELCGVNVRETFEDERSTSKYYGSIIHIALANTRRITEQLPAEEERYGDLRQLFEDVFTMAPYEDIDREVLNMEAVLKFTKEMKKRIEEQTEDPEERMKLATMMLVAGMGPARIRVAGRAIATELLQRNIAAELKEFRGEPERIEEAEKELLERIHQTRFFISVLNSIRNASDAVMYRPRVQTALAEIFPQELLADYPAFLEGIRARELEYVAPFYARLPMIDMTDAEASPLYVAIEQEQAHYSRRGKRRSFMADMLDSDSFEKKRELMQQFKDAVYKERGVDDWYVELLARPKRYLDLPQSLAITPQQREKERAALARAREIIEQYDGENAQPVELDEPVSIECVMALLQTIPGQRVVSRAPEVFIGQLEESEQQNPLAALLRKQLKHIEHTQQFSHTDDQQELEHRENTDSTLHQLRDQLVLAAQLPEDEQERILERLDRDETDSIATVFWQSINQEEANDQRRPSSSRRFSGSDKNPITDVLRDSTRYDDLLWLNAEKIELQYGTDTLYAMVGSGETNAEVNEQRAIAVAKRFDKLLALGKGSAHVTLQQTALKRILDIGTTTDKVAKALAPHEDQINDDPNLRELLFHHPGWKNHL